MNQKKTVISLICKISVTLIVLLIFIGCSRKDINAPILTESINQKSVIERFLKAPDNASDELSYLINDIRQTEEKYQFLYEYAQRNGVPNWAQTESHVPILKSGSSVNSLRSNTVTANTNSGVGSSETYFVPLIDTNTREVKSYIYCVKNSNGTISYKTYNKQAILQSTAKDSNDVKIKGVMLSVFAHFERKINNVNTLNLPFPYNYSFKNVELNFLSSKVNLLTNSIKNLRRGLRALPSLMMS